VSTNQLTTGQYVAPGGKREPVSPIDDKSPLHSEPSIGNICMFQRQAMRRTAVIAIIVVLVGLLLFVVRRPQVWIGHEKIHQNSFSYAGQFSSLKACRSEVEKYGG